MLYLAQSWKSPQSIINVSKRFPLVILSCISIFFLGVWATSNGSAYYFDTYSKLFFSNICGAIWFLVFKLFIESKSAQIKYYYLIGVPIFLLITYQIFHEPYPFSAFAFLCSALSLAIFIAPFLDSNSQNADIGLYNSIFIHNFVLIFVGMLLLFSGAAAIIASFIFLFDIKTNFDVYLYLWLFITSCLAPILMLINIPTEFAIQEKIEIKWIGYFIEYIIIPLLLLYTIILYGYSFKIIISLTLPKGKIAYMVSSFGIIGMFTYLAISCTSQNTHTTITRFFKAYFIKALLPILILLGVGIVLRIQDYGITEPRYAILLCLIWLTISSLHTLFHKQKATIKFTLCSLIFLLILASFGPWGATQMTTKSQLTRLEKLLFEKEILANGYIVPAKTNKAFTRAQISETLDVLNYLESSNRLVLIKPWFAKLPNASIHQSTRVKENDSPYSLSQKIMIDIGLCVKNAICPM